MKISKNKSITSILAVLIALLLIINPATAVTNTNSQNQTVILNVPEFIGFSLSTNTITFNIDSLGTTATTPNYTIQNIGNVNIDLSVKANNDFMGNEQINLADGNYVLICQNTTTNIEKNNNIFKTGLNPQRHKESIITLYQRFTIPYGVAPGTYNTTLTYTAMKSNN